MPKKRMASGLLSGNSEARDHILDNTDLNERESELRLTDRQVSHSTNKPRYPTNTSKHVASGDLFLDSSRHPSFQVRKYEVDSSTKVKDNDENQTTSSHKYISAFKKNTQHGRSGHHSKASSINKRKSSEVDCHGSQINQDSQTSLAKSASRNSRNNT